jgi:hypothetical protein
MHSAHFLKLIRLIKLISLKYPIFISIPELSEPYFINCTKILEL